MAEFDREELKAAFEAGKIPVSADNIGRLDGALRALAQQYRARKVAREQDLSGQLTRLEETKNSLADLTYRSTAPAIMGLPVLRQCPLSRGMHRTYTLCEFYRP